MEKNISRDFFDRVRIEFKEFLYIRDKSLSNRTVERYENDLIFFFEKFVESKVMIDKYSNILVSHRIKGFFKIRKSSTARAVINNLLEFFYYSKKITSDEYMEISAELKKYTKVTKDNIDFLCTDDINFIFSDTVKFGKNKEEKLIAPVIWCLAYYHCFEQMHIENLKTTDIDIAKRLIKNLRSESDESNISVKHIEIAKEAEAYIAAYVDYRKTLKANTNHFLYIDGQPATNSSINKMLAILNERSFNKNTLSTSVHIQKLNRTGIYISLVNSNGASAIKYIHLIGLKKNKQFEYALKKYLLEINSV